MVIRFRHGEKVRKGQEKARQKRQEEMEKLDFETVIAEDGIKVKRYKSGAAEGIDECFTAKPNPRSGIEY